MSRLPRSHFRPSRIEKTREVSFAHLLAGLWGKQFPQGLILVEDLQVALLASGCDFVSAEQKAIRKRLIKFAVVFVASGLGGRRNQPDGLAQPLAVLSSESPRMSETDVHQKATYACTIGTQFVIPAL